jgi:alanine racemase
VGYADGIPRNLGNEKISFLIRNQRVPVVGKICMDMLMVDITDVPDAKEGDEVLIFGSLNDKRISLNELATASGTIPYEILTHLSQRLHRVYSKE